MNKDTIHNPLPEDNARNPEEVIVLIRNATKEIFYVYKIGKQMFRFRGDKSNKYF